MKHALKWGGNALTVILGVLMLLTLYCTISSRINGGTPTIFGKQMYEVLSGSMEPKIHTGSTIFVSPHVNAKNLKPGDVITFTVPHESGIIVTHRIVSVSTQNGQPAFQTKGDANDSKDTWTIPGNNVIGQYSNFTIPYLGYYLNFLKTKLGVSLLMILPGALLIIGTIISLFREITKLQKTNGTGKSATVSNVSSDSVEFKA
jgi:signal peptidase